MAKTAAALIVLCSVLAMPGTSAAAAPEPQSPGVPFPSPFREDDLRQMFDALRDAFIATLKGEEPPAELQDRLERLRERLEGEVNGILRDLLERMQEDLDRALEELQQRRPPSTEPRAERTRL